MAKLKFDVSKLRALGDPREIPNYTISEAARYLCMPQATLRSWVIGRAYPTVAGSKHFRPLIKIADRKQGLLSFANLAEAHVLCAIRRNHKIGLRHIRTALDYVAREFHSVRPLLDADFETNGISLFVNRLGKLVDASAQGQIVMRDLIQEHVKRLEREDRLVTRLYPFTRPQLAESPRSVLIDPRVSFGRPVLAAVRIPTVSLAERFSAGESIEHLAEDYGCERLDVEEALRYERCLAAAA